MFFLDILKTVHDDNEPTLTVKTLRILKKKGVDIRAHNARFRSRATQLTARGHN